MENRPVVPNSSLDNNNPLSEFVQRYELILSSMSEGVYGLDTEGRATFVNPAAEKLTGWAANDTIGKQVHGMHHHTKPDGSPYPQCECPIFNTAQTGVVHSIEYELFWKKDGTSFPVEYSSTPIYQDQQIVGAVVVFKDTSDRKQAEEKLQSAFQQVKVLTEKLEAENRYLKDEMEDELELSNLIGNSRALESVLTHIEQVAPTDATVLIQGESGTGKELIAHAVYQSSLRKKQAIVKVNCGAIPSELVESELFGHEKGAFTGATARHIGRFELANEGTLFLDEVGELPLNVQVKLLRVLQEGEVERVGGSGTIPVDVRVIAATNRDLRVMVDEGSFRSDLYYRLNVFPVISPPLRDRKEDLNALIEFRLRKLEKQLGKVLLGVTNDTMNKFMEYQWPGNIRELNNLLERAAIITSSPWLEVSGLEPSYQSRADSPSSLHGSYNSVGHANPTMTMFEAERAHILHVLHSVDWMIAGKGGAAEALDLPPSTLRSKMKKLDIKRP